jgi:hypothetical protein
MVVCLWGIFQYVNKERRKENYSIVECDTSGCSLIDSCQHFTCQETVILLHKFLNLMRV